MSAPRGRAAAGPPRAGAPPGKRDRQTMYSPERPAGSPGRYRSDTSPAGKRDQRTFWRGRARDSPSAAPAPAGAVYYGDAEARARQFTHWVVPAPGPVNLTARAALVAMLARPVEILHQAMVLPPARFARLLLKNAELLVLGLELVMSLRVLRVAEDGAPVRFVYALGAFGVTSSMKHLAVEVERRAASDATVLRNRAARPDTTLFGHLRSIIRPEGGAAATARARRSTLAHARRDHGPSPVFGRDVGLVVNKAGPPSTTGPAHYTLGKAWSVFGKHTAGATTSAGLDIYVRRLAPVLGSAAEEQFEYELTLSLMTEGDRGFSPTLVPGEELSARKASALALHYRNRDAGPGAEARRRTAEHVRAEVDWMMLQRSDLRKLLARIEGGEDGAGENELTNMKLLVERSRAVHAQQDFGTSPFVETLEEGW
jgi:hypothetical protein